MHKKLLFNILYNKTIIIIIQRRYSENNRIRCNNINNNDNNKNLAHKIPSRILIENKR